MQESMQWMTGFGLHVSVRGCVAVLQRPRVMRVMVCVCVCVHSTYGQDQGYDQYSQYGGADQNAYAYGLSLSYT